MAATRWATTRRQILQGQAAGPAHAAFLQQADQVLRMVWEFFPRLFHDICPETGDPVCRG